MSRIVKMFCKEWHNYDSSNSFISICKIIKLNIICVILLKFQFVQFANAACAFDNLELSGTCYPCNTIVPACQQCDYNGCLSCSEGLYLVVDKQVCVESCDLAIIPSTDANQSKYFARRNSRKCYRCGVECTNCFDELGCTDIIQDPTLTDSTSMLVSVGDGNAKTSKLCSDVITGCKRCNSLGICTLSSSRRLHYKDEYTNLDIIKVDKIPHKISEISKGDSDYKDINRNLNSCLTANCMTCASSTSICDQCNSGYFLESSTKCTSCISNCLVCSNVSSCTQCNSNTFVKESSGACISSCNSNEYVKISGNIRACSSCHSSCESCVNGNTSNQCTKCTLGNYLVVSNFTNFSGSCSTKKIYSSNSDLTLYVSNLSSDVASDAAGTLNRTNGITVDLMASFDMAYELIAQYNIKKNGDPVIINILLYKGDHFILNKNIEKFSSVLSYPKYLDFHSKNFEIIVSPYYCDIAGSLDASICVDASDKVTIYNKLGFKFILAVPAKLTIEHITFDMSEGIIPYQNDLNSSLSRREKVCLFNKSTRVFNNVNSNSSETCSFRNTPTDFCHRSSKYNMIKMTPYQSAYGLTSPPQLILDFVVIENVFYDMNSLVDFSLGGYATITNSEFYFFSTCGALIKNTNPAVSLFLVDSDMETFYFQNFNMRRITDFSSTKYGDYQLTMTNCTIENFNELKTISTYGFYTNSDNGAVIHGYIVHLDSFKGDVILQNNNIQNIITPVSSCSSYCGGKELLIPDAIESLYGQETTPIQTYIFYIINNIGDIIFSNQISNCTASGNIILLNQESSIKTDSTLMFYHNSIRRVGVLGYDDLDDESLSAIRIIKYITPGFENADQNTTISLLSKSNSTMPCRGVAFVNNVIDKIDSCIGSNYPILIQCMFSDDTPYIPPVPANILSSTILKFKTEAKTLVYGSETYSVELNQFTMNSNQISNLIGPPGSAVIAIEGFVKIVQQNNNYYNNGRYLINQLLNFGAINNYEDVATKNYPSCLIYRAYSDTFGFMKLNNSMSILIENTTINNHFFTYGNSSEISEYGSFVTFNQVYGNVTINNLSLDNMTGLLNDYNLNTLDVFNGIPYTIQFNSSNFRAYQFIPVIAFFSPNYVNTFLLNNCTMTNISASLDLDNEGGILFSISKNSINENEVLNTVLYGLNDDQINLYGSAGIIYSQSPFTMSNIVFSNVQKNLIFVDDTGLYGSLIQLRTSFTDKSSISNVTIANNVKTRKSIIDVGSYPYLSSTSFSSESNLIVNSMTATNTVNYNSVIYISCKSLRVEFNDVVINSNVASQLSSIYITDNVIVSFNRIIFKDNTGQQSSEFVITDCDSCIISLTNSSISRLNRNSQSLASGIYRENCIDILNGGEFHIVNSNFSNYQNISSGSILYATSSQIYFQGCQFINNSADIGGVIFLYEDNVLSVSSSIFDSNIAFETSGCIDATFNTNITSQNNIFKNNYAQIHGVINIKLNSIFVDNGSIIQNNTAENLYSVGYGMNLRLISFTGTSFIGNICKSGLSLLSIVESNIVFNQCTFKDNIFQINGTLLNILNSQMSMINSAIYCTSNTQGITLTIVDSNFTNNIINGCYGEKGGALSFTGSNLISINDQFINNAASIEGGGIYGQYKSTASFFNDTFNDNQSPKGASIYIEGLMDYIPIVKSQFYSKNNSQFISGTICSYDISNSSFASTISKSSPDVSNEYLGTAIYLTSTDRLKLFNTQFQNISSNHGVVYISNSVTGISLKNTYALSNLSNFMATISNNTFKNLYNYGEGGGTAVNFDCEIEGCELNLNNNVFQNCVSSTIGGALSYTYFKPLNIQTNTFISNTAKLYGNNIIAAEVSIKFVTEAFYKTNVIVDGDVQFNSDAVFQSEQINGQKSGDIINSIYIGIFDEYGLVKENGVNVYLSLEIIENQRYLQTIQGNLTFSSTRGLFNISEVTIIATPGSRQDIVFRTLVIDTSIPYVEDYLKQQNKTNSDLVLSINLRECIIGEYLKDNGECQECEAGTSYSLIDPTQNVRNTQ